MNVCTKQKQINWIDEEKYSICANPSTSLVTIKPHAENSVEELVEWIKINKSTLRSKLNSVGGLYFHGFDVKTPEDFESIALTIEPELCQSHDFDDGARMWLTPFIYEASPATFGKDLVPLSFHNEDAFLSKVPHTLMLCALNPSPNGGETIIADCRKVFASLTSDLQNKYMQKTILSTFTTPDSVFLVNTRILKHHDEIQKLANNYGAISVERIGEHHTRFSFSIPPVIKHTHRPEPLWFGRAHQASVLTRLVDIWHAYRYPNRRVARPVSLFVAAKTIYFWLSLKLKSIRGKLTKSNMYSNDCRFDDSTAIPLKDQFTICHAYWKNASVIPLKAGDVIILDNLLMTHGRLPYKGKRELLSCMGRQKFVERYEA